MFPIEIWERIFLFTDPSTLLRCKRVCKTWYNIIPRCLEDNNGWYQVCKKYIPEELWSSILEHHYEPLMDWQDFHKAKDNSDVWRSLHESWVAWRRLVDQDYSLDMNSPDCRYRPLERITCVATLSNIVAVATTEGNITLYNVADNSFSTFNFTLLFILEIQLWKNSEDNTMITVITLYGQIWNWNLKYENLHNLMHGTLVSANFQYCCTYNEGFLTIQKPKKQDEGNDNSVGMEIFKYRMEDSVVALGADREEVILWRDGTKQFKLLTKTAQLYEYLVSPPTIPIRAYKIFKPSIATCIGECGEFGFSCNYQEWKMYDLFNHFRASVTAVLFHVAVLVLGLETGEIHLFSIKNVESLDNLDFDTMPSKKIILDTGAIIALNATEYESDLYIVAASDTESNIIKFSKVY